jgi:uncharacterized cupredoxin-like copper-binding protein
MRRIMLKHIAMIAAVMATTAAPAVVEAASDSVMRVALLDMSAVAGGAWSGSGAPGMPPQEGWPGGRGPGGWMRGPHMMGPGMMQGMMMGMMSIRIDRQAIKAGKVELDITNWSRSLVHEVLIVPVDSPDAPLPYDYGTNQVVEDQIDVLAESSELKPSESKTLEVDLSPGSYLLLCNVPGHYASGMVIPLTVTS